MSPNMTALEFQQGLQKLCERAGVPILIFNDESRGVTQIESPTGQIKGLLLMRRVPRKGDPMSLTQSMTGWIHFNPFGLATESRL